MSGATFPWLKGHGTQNDFVLLPDPDGTVHGDLDPAFVAALCDRRRGLGADGVLRVVRTAVVDPGQADEAEWFMDYRNADGSTSEMCGNGVRVFARHLLEAGLATGDAVAVGTRDGVKRVTRTPDGRFTVDMGTARVLGDTEVTSAGHRLRATNVDVGNPHAVAFLDGLVDDLDALGPVLEEPAHDAAAYPHGVNVELVLHRGPGHVAMRVHERGSGETLSCGTGACAVAVAAASADDAPRPAEYRVDLPGGSLQIEWTVDGTVLMTGPAEVVAAGEMEWRGETRPVA